MYSDTQKLENGMTVSQIAFELGYNSPSAFIEMFTKLTGKTPTKFQQNED